MEDCSSAGVALCLCFGAWQLSATIRPQARILLRLATALCCLLALSLCLSRMPDLTLMLPTLTLSALALSVYSSFRRPLPLLVVLTLLTGAFCLSVCAEFLMLPGLILPVQLSAAGLVLFISRKGCLRFSSPSILLVISILAELAALTSGFSPLRQGPDAALLLSSAGLMGISIAVTRISDTSIADIHGAL